MNDLLQTALQASGGISRWKSYSGVSAQMRVTGELWPIAKPGDAFGKVSFHADLHKQSSRMVDIPATGKYTSFEPGIIAIRNNIPDDKSQRTRNDSVKHPSPDPAVLQLLYFSSYTFWNDLTLPYNVTLPGFETEEIQEFQDGQQTLRSLMVTVPENIAPHSSVMVFFFSTNGLLKRIDYEAEILDNMPVTQIISDYKEFDGIKVPTKRNLYLRNADGTYRPDRLLMGMDIDTITFHRT